MAMRLDKTVTRWLRARRSSEEDCVQAARKRQQNAKHIQFTNFAVLGLSVLVPAGVIGWVYLIKPAWDTGASYFMLGFYTGGIFGLGVYAVATMIIITLHGFIGDKRDELMLRFHDELKRRDSGGIPGQHPFPNQTMGKG